MNAAHGVRDYDKFEKDLIKEFKKVKVSSIGEKGRNILRTRSTKYWLAKEF